MRSAITLYKVELMCAETVRDKLTLNYDGFIAYSNTINFSGIWLDKFGCFIDFFHITNNNIKL